MAVVIVAVIAGLLLRRAFIGRKDVPGLHTRGSRATDAAARTNR